MDMGKLAACPYDDKNSIVSMQYLSKWIVPWGQSNGMCLQVNWELRELVYSGLTSS